MDAKLNPPQREAVNTLRGPLLVLAGAGTGKTRVVTFRIANLIRSGIRPSRILAVTFTNKAAAEMQGRARELLGRKVKERPEISTFHSLCLKILRRHATRLGYPETFAIYDRGDQETVARGVLREIRATTEMLRPGDLLAAISGWKTAGVRPEQAINLASTDQEHLAASAYRRYQRSLKVAGAVDFDDLLLCTEELFHRFEGIRRQEAGRFDHLLIDEYQDTNGTQYRIVRALADQHRNLCVVGDDDQSIYGWRGAEVAHILRFNKDWPDAKVVRLEDNYRSTAPILELANRLIAFNRERHDKVLRAAIGQGEQPRIIQYPDEVNEAKGVAMEIDQLISTRQAAPRDIAILFRTKEQPRAFEAELRRLKLPYVLVGGMSFYDRKEVRDLLAYLKVLADPRDEVSLLRIINTPQRGIGQGTVERLLAAAISAGRPVWDVMEDPQVLAELGEKAAGAVKRFRELILGMSQRVGDEPLVDTVGRLIGRIDYRGEIDRLYQDPNDRTARWSAVEELVNSVGNYERRTRQPKLTEFLDDTLLGGTEIDREKENQLKRDAVALLTLHAAKGLEYPHVYLVGMEEGLLPHQKSVGEDEAGIDEERRLCYVGITRAQRRLTLTLALTRMKWGKPRQSLPSRFLFEMTGRADNPQARAQREAIARRVLGPAAKPVKKKAVRPKAGGIKGRPPAKGRPPKKGPPRGGPAAVRKKRPGT